MLRGRARGGNLMVFLTLMPINCRVVSVSGDGDSASKIPIFDSRSTDPNRLAIHDVDLTALAIVPGDSDAFVLEAIPVSGDDTPPSYSFQTEAMPLGQDTIDEPTEKSETLRDPAVEPLESVEKSSNEHSMSNETEERDTDLSEPAEPSVDPQPASEVTEAPEDDSADDRSQDQNAEQSLLENSDVSTGSWSEEGKRSQDQDPEPLYDDHMIEELHEEHTEKLTEGLTDEPTETPPGDPQISQLKVKQKIHQSNRLKS